MSIVKLVTLGGALAILAASALADHRRSGCGSWNDGYGNSGYSSRYNDPYRYRDDYRYRDSYYSSYRPYRYSRYDDCYRSSRRRSPSFTIVLRF